MYHYQKESHAEWHEGEYFDFCVDFSGAVYMLHITPPVQNI